MLKSVIQTFGRISANPDDTDFDPDTDSDTDPDLPGRPARLCGLRVQRLWERHPAAICFAECLEVVSKPSFGPKIKAGGRFKPEE